jgi:nitrite reductase (NO-forming)
MHTSFRMVRLAVALLGMLLLLVLVAPAADTVAKNPNDVPPPVASRTKPITVTINLAAVEVIAELTPGKNYRFWTFARTDNPGVESNIIEGPSVPGPMIRAMEGDTIVLNLTNGNHAFPSVEPHNIDFHAAMGPGGGAAVTNVAPGETKTLTFKALRAAAYIYHCAGEGLPWEHVAHGMYGLIEVEPPGGLPMRDTGGRRFKEFYVGQSDWYLMPDPERPGIYTMDEDKALAEHPDNFSFNGHTAALTDMGLFGEAMRAHVDDPIRIFFVTGGPNVGANFHIIGQIFDRVYTGHPSTAVRNEETVYVAPGSAAVFEMQALVPGKYLLVDHALFRVPKGAAGFLWIDPQCTDPNTCVWPRDLYSPPAAGTGH